MGPTGLTLPNANDVLHINLAKRYEDSLDALVSAWVGTCYLEGNAVPYGDASAAIWCPERSIDLMKSRRSEIVLLRMRQRETLTGIFIVTANLARGYSPARRKLSRSRDLINDRTIPRFRDRLSMLPCRLQPSLSGFEHFPQCFYMIAFHSSSSIWRLYRGVLQTTT